MVAFTYLTECSHSLQAQNFGTSVFQGLFLSFPILILSSSFSLSASFPHFHSFHLRLFNLFNDHSPLPLPPSIITDVLTYYALCVRNALCIFHYGGYLVNFYTHLGIHKGHFYPHKFAIFWCFNRYGSLGRGRGVIWVIHI